jgi:hypothetical protein
MSDMDVQARLRAKTAAFDDPRQDLGAVATATARAIAKAAQDGAAAQAIAAKYSADAISQSAVRQLAATKQIAQASRDRVQLSKLIQRGAIDEASGSQAMAAALQRETMLRREAAAAIRAQQTATEGLRRSGGHGGFTDQMAASAAVRSLSGNAGIRSVERFISILPGMAGALRAIFPIIGAAGLIGLFVDLGEKGYEALTKIKNAAAATRDAFQETHDRAAVTIDDLEIENQRIQDQIDKISKKPDNGVASALLEMKKNADQLVVSLQADRDQLDKLLKENSVGILGGLLTGQAPTGKQDDQLRNDQSGLMTNLRNAALQFGASTAGVSDPKQLTAAGEAYKRAVHTIYQGQIDALRGEAKRLRDEQTRSITTVTVGAQTGFEALGVPSTNQPTQITTPTVDNAKKIQNVEGRAKQLEDAQRIADLHAQILSGNLKLGGLKQGSEASTDANKADEQRLKQMEAALAQLKLNTDMSAKAEFDYWDARRNAFKTGSEAYNAVVEKQAQLAAAGATHAHELILKAKELQKKDDTDGGANEANDSVRRMNDQYVKGLRDQDRTRDESLNGGDAITAIRERSEATAEEARITEAAGRTMTRQAAAIALQTEHTKAYVAQVQRLQAEASRIAQASYLTDPQKAEQLSRIGEQSATLEGQRQVQIQTDQYSVDGRGESSAAVGAAEALNELADSARDVATTVRTLLESSLNSFNSSLVQLITSNHRFGWHQNPLRQAGSDIFKSATGSLLKSGEGMVAGWLGFGSHPKASHVIVDNFPKVNIPGFVPGAGAPDASSTSLSGSGNGALGSTITKILGGAGSGSSDDTDTNGDPRSGGSGILGSIFHALNIPGFADGGSVTPGTLAMVGEQGPELAYFGSGAHIFSNGQSQGMLGGSGFTHNGDVHVHANGSSDPEAIRMATYQGYKRAVNDSMAGMQHAQMENSRRTPGLVRK